MSDWVKAPCKGCGEIIEDEGPVTDDNWWCSMCWPYEERNRLRAEVAKLKKENLTITDIHVSDDYSEREMRLMRERDAAQARAEAAERAWAEETLRWDAEHYRAEAATEQRRRDERRMVELVAERDALETAIRGAREQMWKGGSTWAANLLTTILDAAPASPAKTPNVSIAIESATPVRPGAVAVLADAASPAPCFTTTPEQSKQRLAETSPATRTVKRIVGRKIVEEKVPIPASPAAAAKCRGCELRIRHRCIHGHAVIPEGDNLDSHKEKP